MPTTPAQPLAQPPGEDDEGGTLSLRHMLPRGLRVLIVCVTVGLTLGFISGQQNYLRSTVYSVSIGMGSWAFIDFGRFALRPDPHSGWPLGWRGLALCIVGNVFGFAFGQALGDLINGFEVYASYRLGVRKLGVDIAVSAAIGTLLSGYFYLRGKESAHRAAAARAGRDLSLARLNLLQSQLEPHMLFNTLANLRVLIGLDPPRAQAMLDRLNAYLRATLGASRSTWHPLSAEFDRLADYLALMAVRMGPRLAVQLDLPDALRLASVPPLLLQPLVENAIKHGLEPKVEGGRIHVQAEQRGGMLHLTVRDTGNGLPADSSPNIPRPDPGPAGTAASDQPHPSPGGYGTQHVAERLATLYGAQASLTLRPAADAEGGALAEVTLPLTLTLPNAN